MIDTHQQALPAAPDVGAVQQRYAALLEWSVRISMVLLIAGFLLYAGGLLPSHVPVQRVPEYWGQPLKSFLALTEAHPGWYWVTRLDQGDMLAMSGIALLAGCSGVCLVSLVALYARRGDWAYAGLSLAHAAVMIVAASGWLGGVH